MTLGIDLSTQGVKAVIRDLASGEVVFAASVNYGKDLPEFGAPNGYVESDDPAVRVADPAMWVAGLKLLLSRLHESKAPLDRVQAIGGDAQQHAIVCLAADGSYSRRLSPIWMDSSTHEEVRALNLEFGGEILLRTGSPAVERFAAAQILKFRRTDSDGFARTARIHLLSSFLSSVLTESDAPVELGDGAGTNLIDLRRGTWDPEICEFIDPSLSVKLPHIVCSSVHTTLPLAASFARYGLRPGIPVVPFTGDNPASLIGCGAERPGTAVISLGTSDTFFAAMSGFRTDPDGCGSVFGNPLGGFMALSCFKNGSLARDRVRRDLGVDWKFFDETAWESGLRTSHSEPTQLPRAFPYFEEEITPRHAATGIEADFDWGRADSATKVRAIVEGQMANMYEHTRWIGEFESIVVTGGASRSSGILRTIERVFKANARTLETADSAALGAACLAAVALRERRKADAGA